MISSFWKQKLEAVPESASTCYHLAVMEYNIENEEKAIELLRKSLFLRESAAAYRALARLLMLQGDAKQCLPLYAKALQLTEPMPELVFEFCHTLHALA